jgi:hypothetical protein
MTKPTGFSFPLSWQQVLSWLLTLFWLSLFGLTLSLYNAVWQIILLISLFFLVFFLVFYTVKIMKSDPTDPYVFTFRDSILNNKPFTLEFHNFCALCGTPVQDQSKHCMVCYRCVNEFDHHCTWVNNCIGAQNYSDFFKMIVFFELFLVLGSFLSVHCLTRFWDRSEELLLRFRRNFSERTEEVFIGFLIVSCVSSGICALFNGYLILFHTWLYRKRLTTFQYLSQLKRSRVTAERPDQENDAEMVELNKTNKLNNSSLGR